MKVAYKGQLDAIDQWLRDINNKLTMGISPTFLLNDCQKMQTDLREVAKKIKHEYPFYSQTLPGIGDNLFRPDPFSYGLMALNVAAFGELFIIVQHLVREPVDMRFWQDIHPRIIEVSKELFCDGHFAAASESAIKEVETRMRELFKEEKPNSPIPKDAAGLIGALLSDNGFYQFCDTSEISRANFRKGVKSIFEGAFMAYRNPSMHANLTCSQREAFERIVQASQMMGILTSGEVRI